MPKTPGDAGDSADSTLRAIPAVERILASPPFHALAEEFGRARVKQGVVAQLDALRRHREPYDEALALDAVRERLATSTSSTLCRVINGSGVIIHTNLGRAPLAPSLLADASRVLSGYSNLEFDLDTGDRGARDEHLSAICAALFGCEAAVLTNNNAAATLLLLAAVAARKEVLVSRGELVEIGGAFRVPEVIEQGGAKLREVGTTNRTRASDYADAATPRKTAAILRVHRSNFEIVGFTETPTIEELVEIAKKKRIPLLYDEGSGRVVDLTPYGFASEPTISEAIAAGVHAVTCSTDKLIGATQGGLILGGADIIAKCRRHPLMRALRAGKESYAIIAETLRAFATGKHEERIPIYAMLAAPLEALRERARQLIEGTSCRLTDSDCALGGGTTPAETIPSVAIEVPGNASALQDRFLENDPPIVGRVREDRYTIETRTLLDDDLPAVAAALRAAAP